MKYCAQSPMAPRRTDAVLEYWEDSLEKVSMCITPLLRYSSTPKVLVSDTKTEAEENMALNG